jgi:hypothetical protein
MKFGFTLFGMINGCGHARSMWVGMLFKLVMCERLSIFERVNTQLFQRNEVFLYLIICLDTLQFGNFMAEIDQPGGY